MPRFSIGKFDFGDRGALLGVPELQMVVTLIKIGVSSLQPRLHLRQLGYLRYFFRKAKQNSGGQLE
jgi:hypothetical protein